ncbi:MAG: flagellar motor switch protein FliG [Acidobacteria bacterium]|nr:flagellar motor switch protein FliG [Acidobacteriota bacterium]
MALSGIRKSAILLAALGEEPSSAIFKHLTNDEIERIVKELAQLGAVPPDTGERVLTEFNDMASAAEYVNQGGVDFARKLLERTLGVDESRRILERLARQFKSTVGFVQLERADPQQLSKFILGEHPQTIALIMAHLHPNNAAELVSLLPEAIRVEVLTRMANLDEISPEVIAQISALIDQRLTTLGRGSREQRGGIRAVAELFNRLDRGISKEVLETIETDSPDLAVSIRNLMFVFDDLRQVEDNGLREIIQRADKKGLAVALKGASEDIRTRFFGNMSKRAADMLKEEMDVLGPTRLREVEKAQQEIVAIARKLEEEGLITTGAAAGEAYVV